MAKNGTPSPGRRAALVAGLRTPFLKAGGDFRDLSAVELGALLVNELVARSGIPPREFDAVIFGQVVPSQLVSLVAREVALRVRERHGILHVTVQPEPPPLASSVPLRVRSRA
jgi:acetyl-CoA acyltransferase